MRMIKVAALDNGAHENQTYHGTLPEGWALIPDSIAIPDTFPFVDITAAANAEGVLEVASMTAGVMPEPEPLPEPEASDTDVLNALLGVSE